MVKNYVKRSIMLLGASAIVLGAYAENWVDVTNKYLQEPSYSPNWQGSYTGYDYGVAEVWNGAFKVYQILNDMPEGEYTLTANALYRCGYNDYSKENMKGVDVTPELYTACIFINDTKKAVAGVFDEVKELTPEETDYDPEKYAPNWLKEANDAFEAGKYLNYVTVNHKGGDMVIGIMNTGSYDDEWCAFDNFKLTGPNGEIEIPNGDFSVGLDSKRAWNIANAEGGEKAPDMQKDGSGGGSYRKCGGSPYKYGQQIELPAGKYRYGMLTFHRYGSTLNPDGTYYQHKSGDVTEAYGALNRTPKDWYDANDYDEVSDEEYAHAYLFVSWNEDCPNILKWYDSFGDLTDDQDIRVRIKDAWEICKGNYDEMPDNNPYGNEHTWELSREDMSLYQTRNASNYWHDSGNEREAAAAFVANPEKWYQYVEFELTEPAKVWVGMGKDANTGDGYWHAWADQTLKMLVEGAGVNEISAENENAPIEYYTINGLKVNNPANGIYIVKQGSKVTKKIFK